MFFLSNFEKNNKKNLKTCVRVLSFNNKTTDASVKSLDYGKKLTSAWLGLLRICFKKPKILNLYIYRLSTLPVYTGSVFKKYVF